MSREKGSKPKGKVRVLAVKRPRTGIDISEEELPESPYVTQDQMAEWLGLASDNPDQELSLEQTVALGLAIQARMNENPDPATGQFMAIIMSGATSDLFGGDYAPTKSNPFYAMETFLTYRRVQLYPPSWVLEWLAKAFDGYIRSEGEEDLNQLLGIKRGKGQPPAYKRANSALAESHLMWEMGLLWVVGATIVQAAEMVVARQEALDVDCSAVDTLTAQFSKLGLSKYFKQVKAMSPTLSPDETRETFAAYPPHSIPAKFK